MFSMTMNSVGHGEFFLPLAGKRGKFWGAADCIIPLKFSISFYSIRIQVGMALCHRNFEYVAFGVKIFYPSGTIGGDFGGQLTPFSHPDILSVFVFFIFS